MGDGQAAVAGVVVGPGEGWASEAGPSTTVFKLTGEQTNGRVTLVEQTLQPGVLIPPHTHRHFDESTYVLEGELSFELGADIVRAPAGSVVFRPRGLRHALWNSGDVPSRIVEVYAPGGHERLFEELAKLQAQGALEPSRVLEVGRAYDTEYDMDHAGELAARYGLRLPGQPPPLVSMSVRSRMWDSLAVREGLVSGPSFEPVWQVVLGLDWI